MTQTEIRIIELATDGMTAGNIASALRISAREAYDVKERYAGLINARRNEKMGLGIDGTPMYATPKPSSTGGGQLRSVKAWRGMYGEYIKAGSELRMNLRIDLSVPLPGGSDGLVKELCQFLEIVREK